MISEFHGHVNPQNYSFYAVFIDTFAQCEKECTDALWISKRNSIKVNKEALLYLHNT